MRGFNSTLEQAGTERCFVLQRQERWYVVRTQPSREQQAQRQLANQSFRTFNPRRLKTRRHARKVETVLASLFPQYLFIILDLTRDRWLSVNSTFGVQRLLMRGNGPEPVPHGLVEGLISVTDATGIAYLRANLKPGQTVRVTAGPFADVIGLLERLDDSGRVRVLLEIMGGSVPVTLPQTLVAPRGHV